MFGSVQPELLMKARVRGSSFLTELVRAVPNTTIFLVPIKNFPGE